MVRLTTKMSPLLKEDVIVRLNAHKIYSINDVLEEDSEKLVHITKLPYKDVIQLKHNLIANYAAFPCIGLDTYNDLVANSALIPSGIEGLDGILDGGFLTGNLYEICGLSATGKTQLCLTVSANVAQFLKQPIHYIDTKMDFSGKRIQAMLEAKGCSEEDVGIIMERIQVTRVKDIYQLLSFLHSLKMNLHQEHDEKSGIRLIIIDSLPSIFFPYLGSNYSSRLGFMNHMANVMKYIALEYNIPFLLVNLITRWYSEESVGNNEMEDDAGERLRLNNEISRPSLGKYWSHVPSTRLCIQNTKKENIKEIHVVRALDNPIPKMCTVNIGIQGVT